MNEPNGRILIVEDDAHTRELVRYNLERAGYGVVEAHDGEQALAEVEQGVFDLVICDLMMPRFDGVRLRDLIRGGPCHFQVPFLYLTAASPSSFAAHGLDAEREVIVGKPFDPIRLIAIAASAIAASQAPVTPAPLDDLTGLHGPQCVQMLCDREITRIDRQGGHGTLVLARLSPAEPGLAPGDDDLMRFVDAARSSSRRNDILGRLDLERFAFYLPDTPLRSAAHLLKRIELRIHEALRRSETAPDLLAGLAEAPKHGDNYRELLQVAELALEQAEPGRFVGPESAKGILPSPDENDGDSRADE